MLGMLKARKEQLKAEGQSGFTLMEMLIVIAIIAILIAIAIPIFATQLAKANAATDEANIRSGYAQVQSDLMLDKPTGSADVTYYLKEDGTITKTATEASYRTKGSSKNVDGAGSDNKVKILGISALWSDNQIISYVAKKDTKTDVYKIDSITASTPSTSGGSEG